MDQVTIPKRRGGKRTIYVPSDSEKTELRVQLAKITKASNKPPAAYAFVKGRNVASMARQHVGFAFTLSFDPSDCFDHVTAEILDREGIKYDPACLVDGAARQGLPTSPVLANLALAGLDDQVSDLIKAYCPDDRPRCVYTRYADDLVLSFDDPDLVQYFRRWVPEICEAHGFPVNSSKTRVQSAKAGRRIICGVGVGATDIHPTRETRRRHRAAAHRGHTRIARGLGEWMALRDPRRAEDVSDALKDAAVEPEMWRHILSAGKTARVAAAGHPDLPPTMARRLARSTSADVLSELADNESVPVEIRMAAQMRVG